MRAADSVDDLAQNHRVVTNLRNAGHPALGERAGVVFQPGNSDHLGWAPRYLCEAVRCGEEKISATRRARARRRLTPKPRVARAALSVPLPEHKHTSSVGGFSVTLARDVHVIPWLSE